MPFVGFVACAMEFGTNHRISHFTCGVFYHGRLQCRWKDEHDFLFRVIYDDGDVEVA